MDVLLLRAGALGDVLLLRRVVFALRAHGARVTLVAPRTPGRALLGQGPSEVDRLVEWERPEIAALLAGSGDPVPDLAGHDVAVAYTRSADLVAALRPRVHRLIARDPAPPDGVHASRWLADAVRPLGVERADDPPPLRISDAERKAADPPLSMLGGGFLAVHPGAGSPGKRWPAARFAEVVDALSRGGPWALIEGPADADCARPLRALPGAVRVPSLPVRALGALLSHAGLYVGNDSGVSHLAAAVAAPTLALFGPTDPTTWAPVGVSVQALRGSDGSLHALGTAAVIEAARALLGRVRPDIR